MNWIELLAPMLAALAGSLFGVRLGIARLRNEMAFKRRLKWYQTASEASLHLRYTLQQVIDALQSDAESARADAREPWNELTLSLDAFLDVVLQSHMFARASSYRKVRRIPVKTRELFKAFPDGPDHRLLEELVKSLRDFKKDIAVITRILTDDLRHHLGLKGLSRPKGLHAWLTEKKTRWADDHPLVDVLEARGWKYNEGALKQADEHVAERNSA